MLELDPGVRCGELPLILDGALRSGVGDFGRFLMSRRRLISSLALAGAALFILFQPTLPARADDWANCPIQTGGQPSGQQAPTCSLTDIGNALQNTYNGFTNGQCAAACSDPVTCALAVWATVAVGGMGSQSQGFCNAVSQASNWTGSVASDTQTAKNLLNQAGSSFASQFESYLNSLGSTVSDIASIETPFTCACSIAAGLGQTFSDLGSCVESALCSLSNWLNGLTGGWISSCTSNISVSWGNCNQLGCAPPGSDGCPIVCNSAKTVCFQPCGEAVGACSCPPPMVLGTAGPDNPAGGVYQTLSCNCPPNTHAPPNAGGVVNVCICDKTGLVAQPPTNPTGMCPIPLTGLPCPKGQTNYGGTCRQTCPAGEAPLAKGLCCAPSQASSCGQCCPAGQAPDPRTGGCGQPLSLKPNAPNPRSRN
jgi:hypothetical protein